MILDACCGPKMMYKGLHKQFSQDEIIFMDIRKGHFFYDLEKKRPVNIEPDIMADLKHLPFRDSVFSLIMFDPPHGDFSIKSFFCNIYGSLRPQEYITLLIWANIEFARVLKDDGYIFAKIHCHDGRDKTAIRNFTNFKLLMTIELESRLYKKGMKGITRWMLFVKRSADKLSGADGNGTQAHRARSRPRRGSRLEPSQPATSLSSFSAP